MVITSKPMQEYFERLQSETLNAYKVAQQARQCGFDPEPNVDVPLAANMAERVAGLVSLVAPQLDKPLLANRIKELEAEFEQLDWRVALKAAEEVANQKFCTFKSREEAMEVGIRVGFAYLTLGIVSAPLEGFIGIKLKKRKDEKDYLAVYYAGPVRGAGGTAAATSVILADYIRTVMGLSPYDPTEEEVNRYVTEIHDYHERVTNLQYHPSDDEIKFLARHIPVEINGDPTEQIEVSNHKDLPRVETNRIRGGICLVLAEGIAQKSPKLWKRLGAWGKSFQLNWDFLAEFLDIQKRIKAQAQVKSEGAAITPNFTYIMDLVAGRPVLGHPMKEGGFRLRYGRTRTTGFSAAGIHPATMLLLNKYIAIGTQLKLERPGKAAAITSCDTIDGPIVKLRDGSVRQLKDINLKSILPDVNEILYLGDILIAYGDFSENNHKLVPAGYCPEWWVRELEKAIVAKYGALEIQKAAAELNLDTEYMTRLQSDPATTIPSYDTARLISKAFNIPIHPSYDYYWRAISPEDILLLLDWCNSLKTEKTAEGKITKLILPYSITTTQKVKRALELIGITHDMINNEFIVINGDDASAFYDTLQPGSLEETKTKIRLAIEKNPQATTLGLLNIIAPYTIMDKCGTFIGARMGRPEKAKMRKLAGSPHILFPVGAEGDRLRSFQSALQNGKVTAEFPTYVCPSCKSKTIYLTCEGCQIQTTTLYNCRICGESEKPGCTHGEKMPFRQQELDVAHYFTSAVKRLGLETYPDNVKGVRGTSNKNHVVEHMAKGILRAKHGIYVNKDGTTRYDMTELPMTHFKPKEIGTKLDKLHKLGYTHDAYGNELTDENQICELKPQDIVLPSNENSLDESAKKVLFRIAKFIDELLIRLYNLQPYYNLKDEEDIVGHLVVGLAPHISAGMIGRIIGFSETQGCFAHPLWHAGLRRDCFTYDAMLPIYDGTSWKNTKIGKLVEQLNPVKIVDSFGTREIKVSNYQTIGLNTRGTPTFVKINNFTKHMPTKIINIKTKSGREISTTTTHKFLVGDKIKRADELRIGDKLPLPRQIHWKSEEKKEIRLVDVFAHRQDIVVRGIHLKMRPSEASKRTGIPFPKLANFFSRNSFPIDILESICSAYKLNIHNVTRTSKIAAKRDTVLLPSILTMDENLMEYLGLYVAEGYSRYVTGKKGYAQVYVTGFDKEIRDKVIMFGASIGLTPTENKLDRITFSSRIWYEIITKFFRCGSSAYEKRVPNILFSANSGLVGAFLRGYFEGDGSVSISEKRVCCDSVSNELLQDVSLLLLRFGIFSRLNRYSKQPGPQVRAFYTKKKRPIPIFSIEKLTIPSDFVSIYAKRIGFITQRKRGILAEVAQKNGTGMRLEYDSRYIYDEVTNINFEDDQVTYCLNVENNVVLANGILTRQCDGDECCVMLLLDALLNFSRQYLPNQRGAKTMDSPLILTSLLVPSEVDDQSHGVDVVWKYPLELYEAALQYKPAGEVKIEQIRKRLNTEGQYERMGFTHLPSSINLGVKCSAYKTIPTMEEKLRGQVDLAKKIRAVDEEDVARLVIEKHFIKDIKGNLRQFSTQQFRCSSCNAKFRRPPLIGKCTSCNGNILFTVTEGSVIKYLESSITLARDFSLSPYLNQSLEIVKRRIHGVFGKEKEKQAGLQAWTSSKPNLSIT